MLKRAINPQFRDPVLNGTKRTTIRAKPWPVETPIMLFRWEGKPYRSRQINVCCVTVLATAPIEIRRQGDAMEYRPAGGILHSASSPLWKLEGFASSEEMDAWFRRLVRPGEAITHRLMAFEILSGLQAVNLEIACRARARLKWTPSDRHIKKLVKRFGWQWVFDAAKHCEDSRRDKWARFIESHSIYLPESVRMSRRANYAHAVGSFIYHKILKPVPL